jgi:hypothetical protein
MSHNDIEQELFVMIKEKSVRSAFDALKRQHPDMDPDEIWAIVTDLYDARGMTREVTA